MQYMRYQVPQFIEVEDKIFGPLTFKQFAYVAGGAGVCFAAYKLLSFYTALIVIVPAAALSGALAFYRVNNRPFIDVVESAFDYFLGTKLYIWHKIEKTPEEMEKEKENEADAVVKEVTSMYVPRLSDSKLKDLAWSLDVNETVYSREARKFDQGQSAPNNKPF